MRRATIFFSVLLNYLLNAHTHTHGVGMGYSEVLDKPITYI